MIDFDITGFILAGGKSSRMGTDKGLLPLGGEPMIRRIIRQLQPAVKNITIVANNPEYEKFGLEVCRDQISGIGPAGGIYTALQRASSEKLFIISCDMPFITCGAIRYIIQRGVNAQIGLPVTDGHIQPLCGVYSRECLPPWKQLIDSGITTLKTMITSFDLLEIPVNNNKLFDRSTFMNVNDNNDFENALKYYHDGN